MGSITVHTCGECEYYNEPFNDYPDRGVYECYNCNEWFCDECQQDHAQFCLKCDSVETKCEWCDKTFEEEDIFKCLRCDQELCYDCSKEHAVECAFE